MTRLRVALTALCLLGVLVACREENSEPGPAPPDGPESTATTTAPTPPIPAPGVTHGTLDNAGRTRTYRLFVPSGLAGGERVPLVVGLHGGLGTGDQFAANSHFEANAEAEKFIAVFPDGVSRTWNGGNCCGAAARENIDDVGFLAALIADLSARLPIDPVRVFMTGHSNGAIMAFRFGCERPALVLAIAPVAGSLETTVCTAPSGTSLFAIHGDADQNHPLDGGQGPRSIAGVEFVSMDDSLALWIKAMGCKTPPEGLAAGAVTSTIWSGCRDGAEATFSVIAGADHPWPGGAGSAVPGVPASNAMDATTEIWAFFESLE